MYKRCEQRASSFGNWAYCYAELVVSSLDVAVTVASTHEGMAVSTLRRTEWLYVCCERVQYC